MEKIKHWFCEAFECLLFIFSISALIVFRSSFLRDCCVVFFLDIIPFIFSPFSVYSLWVCRASITIYCVSIRLECSCFSVFNVAVTVLGFCWHDSFFICWCITNISRSENQLFFIAVLAWSASLWLVVLNLAHSSQILSISFLNPLFVGWSLRSSKVQTCCFP